jgi:pimeloyl-ACP methyl ester carboxylesterase
VLFDRWIADAAGKGLTLISYDRPGYGGSSARPGRTVADCAFDVQAIRAALGFQRCAVWGFSGGGPHALACGALLGELVAAVATIGSPAPFDAPGLDFFAGMRDGAREDIELFDTDRAEWERQGQQQRDDLVTLSAPELAAQFAASADPVDAAALAGEFGTWLHRAEAAGLAPGPDGWTDDDIAIFHSPWGFDPASISVPTKIWHGRQDRFVPVGHGQWLARSIPGAQSDLSDDDGHMTVAATRIGDVHNWLAQYL